MVIRDVTVQKPAADLIEALSVDRHWHRVAVVVSGVPGRSDLNAICDVVRRHGAQIVLYDAAASSGFHSPYPPEQGNWLPELLYEADMQRVGRDDLAQVAHQLTEEGLLAGIYLAPRTDAADLDDLVGRENIDLVVALLPADDRRLDRVREARKHAHVLLAGPGARPELLRPLQPGEDLPVAEGIRWPYLLVVFVTFLLAGVRNRG